MTACLEKMEPNQGKVETKTGAYPERMESSEEKLEASDLEANPEEIEALAGRQEMPNKEAAVETMGALEDRSGDQQQAVGYRNPRKRRTKDPVKDGRSRRDVGRSRSATTT
jgi:hypothetical protein